MRQAVVAVLVLAFAAPAAGGAGALDLGFGEDGIAQLNVSDDLATSASAKAVLVESDGRVVAAGFGHKEGALVRYRPDGTLDPSFGHRGRVLLRDYFYVVALARQSDGALLALGRTAVGGVNLLRLRADGSLDPSFGSDGLVVVPVSSALGGANTLAVLADDSIAVAGAWQAAPATPSTFAAVRFTADGVLDAGFGIGGLATIDISGGYDYAQAIVARPDGALVLAGSAANATERGCAVARLTAAGIPDPTFGSGGVVVVDLSAFADEGIGVAVQPDGAVVVAATTVIGTEYGFGVFRLLDDGSLDPSFAAGGIARTAVSAAAYGFARTAGGGFAVAGSDGQHFVVARFTAAGALDAAFGDQGVALTAIGTDPAIPWALAAAADGALVAAGEARTRTHFWDEYRFALVRYAADGALDPAFGADGIVTTAVGGSFDRILAVAAQPDGRLVVGGVRESPIDGDFALGRFNADGTVDASFASGGVTTTSYGARWDEIRGVVVQPDGAIVAAGSAWDGIQSTFVLVRHRADGTIDPTFGDAGVVRTVPGGIEAGAWALARQSDGRLVAAGFLFDGSTTRIALARYLVSGALDPAFGSGGTVSTAIGDAAEARALVVQPDGKLVVAGRAQSPGDRLALVRYLADGSPDPTFGTLGVATPAIPPAQALALQPDGRLLVTGRFFNAFGWDVFVARLNGDGTIDTGFGTGGMVITDLGATSADEHANAIAVLPSGQIAVGGAHKGASATEQVLLLYPPDGSAVAMQTLAIGGPHSLRYAQTAALLVQPDGKLVAAGTGNGDFAAVRYRGEHLGCPSRPLTCRAAGRTLALLRNDANDARDRLVWKWLRGAPTTIGELGDPRAGTSYALCVYAGDPPVRLAQALLPPDVLRWRALGDDGYRYRDPTAGQDGIGQMLLAGSAVARSRVLVTGRGAALPDVPLPLVPPVQIQLVNLATEACWGSTLDAAALQRNDSRLFRARQ